MQEFLIDCFDEIGQTHLSKWVKSAKNFHRFSALLYSSMLLDLLDCPADLPISAQRAEEMSREVYEAYKIYRLTKY